LRQVCHAFIECVVDNQGARQAQVLENAGKDLRQSNSSVRILEVCLAHVIVLLPGVTDETWLLVQEQVDQAAQQGRGTIDP
jgi:hypothetical protein